MTVRLRWPPTPRAHGRVLDLLDRVGAKAAEEEEAHVPHITVQELKAKLDKDPVTAKAHLSMGIVAFNNADPDAA